MKVFILATGTDTLAVLCLILFLIILAMAFNWPRKTNKGVVIRKQNEFRNFGSAKEYIFIHVEDNGRPVLLAMTNQAYLEARELADKNPEDAPGYGG